LIESILEDVINDLKEDEDSIISFSDATPVEMPTMKPEVSLALSPQLKACYAKIESWRDATHGDWLSIREMMTLWSKEIADPRLSAIKENLSAAEWNWPDDAAALFRPERLTVFAASEYTSERIYLLWLASTKEPELWVYDTNGESRYKDLAAYLTAYLEDDGSALENRWKLSDG
jgi:hypothetical protein